MSEKELNTGKDSKIFINLAYLYVSMPFIIFVIGWIKWYYAIIIVTCVIVSLFLTFKNTDAIWIPDLTKMNILKIFIIVLLISIIVCISGIGNLVWQYPDHLYRNTIFRILCEDKWPLISYEWNQNGSGLIYYIGFWLPSAVVGKITNLSFGYYFQIIWAITGVLLVYYLMCAWVKKILVWPLLILLFFSGLDVVGYMIVESRSKHLALISYLEEWTWYTTSYTPYIYQYSSIITQLFWVFNQAIPAWCITMLLFMQDNSKNLVFLLALSMLSSTLPFMGLIPLVIYFTITKGGVNILYIHRANVFNKIKIILKEVCSIQNIFGGGIIGIISFLYLRGNSAGQYIGNIAYDFNIVNYIINFLVYYIFCFFEAGIYLFCIYKYQIKNGLFYIVGISLYVIPLIKVGTSIDFCMRASIPALFLLILLIIDTILKAKQLKDYKTIVIITVILLIGSATPILEINRTIYNTYKTIKEDGQVKNKEVNKKEVYKGLNFSGDIKDNIFYEMFVK